MIGKEYTFGRWTFNCFLGWIDLFKEEWRLTNWFGKMVVLPLLILFVIVVGTVIPVVWFIGLFKYVDWHRSFYEK